MWSQWPRNDALKCIYVGLLCVQGATTDRPKISVVVLVLNSYNYHQPPCHHGQHFSISKEGSGLHTQCSRLTMQGSNQSVYRALLTKLGWKIAFREQSLWSNILRNKSFFAHKPPAGASGVWRGIISSKDVILAGTCFKIGNRISINPWSDPWVPGVPGYVPRLKERVNGSWINCVAQLRSRDSS